jgi:hypothetical protein
MQLEALLRRSESGEVAKLVGPQKRPRFADITIFFLSPSREVNVSNTIPLDVVSLHTSIIFIVTHFFYALRVSLEHVSKYKEF